ncbi:MAG TPA: hemolysin III family protein [Gemmataceae bacterium]|jgi:hemolysin III
MESLPTLGGLRDPVSSLTHLGTAVFAVYVTLLFARLAGGDRVKRRGLLTFGLSMVVLYAASGLYHAVPGGHDDPLVVFFRRLDVSAIFLLIAGSFTPVIAVVLTGRRRRTMLAVMWSLAGVGIASRWLWSAVPQSVTDATFFAAGLPGFLPVRRYYRALGGRAIAWGAVGCACYIAGAVIDLANWPAPVPGLVNAHDLTHLLDMTGTAAHVLLVLRFVVPYNRPARRRRHARRRTRALAANV